MKRRDKPCNEKRDERRDAEETGGGDGEDKHGGMACQNDIHMPIGLLVLSPPDRISGAGYSRSVSLSVSLSVSRSDRRGAARALIMPRCAKSRIFASGRRSYHDWYSPLPVRQKQKQGYQTVALRGLAK